MTVDTASAQVYDEQAGGGVDGTAPPPVLTNIHIRCKIYAERVKCGECAEAKNHGNKTNRSREAASNSWTSQKVAWGKAKGLARRKAQEGKYVRRYLTNG